MSLASISIHKTIHTLYLCGLRLIYIVGTEYLLKVSKPTLWKSAEIKSMESDQYNRKTVVYMCAYIYYVILTVTHDKGSRLGEKVMVQNIITIKLRLKSYWHDSWSRFKLTIQKLCYGYSHLKALKRCYDNMISLALLRVMQKAALLLITHLFACFICYYFIEHGIYY